MLPQEIMINSIEETEKLEDWSSVLDETMAQFDDVVDALKEPI